MTTKILVVDDELEMLDFIKTGLEFFGFSVTVVSDALEAIPLTHAIKPDVIVLDYEMPGIDGYSVFRGLSASRITKDIPVIFITGYITRSKVMERISSLNAFDCLLKPFEINTLVNIIKTAVSTKKAKLQSTHLTALSS